MSRSLNKVMLIGNVGSDPEVKTTGSGTKVVKLSLATNYRFKDRSGEFQDKTEWHRITFFARLADIVEQYVSKGDPIYVEGRIEYSQTEDPQGNVRYWTDIVGNEMVMLGSRAGGSDPGGQGGGGPRGGYGGGGGQRDSQGGGSTPDLSQPDDDLPF
ncbi:MAG: single-stranded DNA-binding protein [Gemmatimonadales bacterium]|nr:MAG: single-stranded DNA-binding protein [Gemmatimonadales bacterium]